MTSNDNGLTAQDCKLHRFERNRFFHGKLLTARDLTTEQRYHTGRLNTLTRLLAGSGLFCGLDTTVQDNEAENRTEAVIQPGAALDCCGRPIVIANRATKPLDPRPTKAIHLYLTYAECDIETVPVPGSEQACEEECTYNRVLETFALEYDTVETTPDPDLKSVPEVTFPDKETVEGDEEGSLRSIARSYYDHVDGDEDEDDSQHLPCLTCENPRVYLGTFTPGEGNEWTWEGSADRPLVYHNELLYASIARHATGFGNPHETTLDLARPAGDEQGALVRVADDPRDIPDIELDSGDETVTVTADAEQRTIDLSVTGLAELQDLVDDHLTDTENPHEVTLAVRDPPGGVRGARIGIAEDDRADVDIVLAAASENVTFTRNGDRQIDLSVDGGEVEVPDDLVQRLDDLEERVKRSERALLRHRAHVMERSLWCKCRSFGGLDERFDVDVRELVGMAKEALAAHEFEDLEWDEYHERLKEIFEFEEQIGQELEEQDVDVEAYMRALGELKEALDEEDLLRLAVAQDRLCGAVNCLGRDIIPL